MDVDAHARQGRVFYTAYGHDARTWGQPGFHDLIERGIRWAANKGDVYDSRPRVAKGLKPFEYAPAEIPLYTPGARWGTLGEPIRKMQKPLAPEESEQHLVLPTGLRAKLFVAEPQIFKPITMTWDHLAASMSPRRSTTRMNSSQREKDATGFRSWRTLMATARRTRCRSSPTT